jgi:hypothetical protein
MARQNEKIKINAAANNRWNSNILREQRVFTVQTYIYSPEFYSKFYPKITNTPFERKQYEQLPPLTEEYLKEHISKAEEVCGKEKVDYVIAASKVRLGLAGEYYYETAANAFRDYMTDNQFEEHPLIDTLELNEEVQKMFPNARTGIKKMVHKEIFAYKEYKLVDSIYDFNKKMKKMTTKYIIPNISYSKKQIKEEKVLNEVYEREYLTYSSEEITEGRLPKFMIKQLDSIAEICPCLMHGHYAKGFLNYYSNNEEKAAEGFEKAFEAAPTKTTYWLKTRKIEEYQQKMKLPADTNDAPEMTMR